MPRPRVYVTRELFAEAIELLRTAGEVRVWPGEQPPPHETLRAEAASADALLCLLTDRIDAPLLEAAPRLRVVSTMAVGYDNIDVAAATRRGVYVGYTPGVLTETTAEFTIALLLAWARRIPEAQRFAREGRWRTWSPMALLGRDLRDATLGVVGLGRIGEAVAWRARGLGMGVIYHSRTRRPEAEASLGIEFVPDLRTLLGRADFVSLHVPLTPQTKGLVGEAELAAMRPGAVLINTARGDLVDQRALRRALESGRIGGAALDVTDPEPMPPDDPLLRMENVLVTPHIASATRATRLKMAMMAAQNVVDVLSGRPPVHCANPEAGRRS